MIDPEVLAGFAAFGESGPLYCDGSGRNCILLKTGKTCVYLTSVGEPASDGVVKVFRQALAAGPMIHLHKYLIDLSAYHGVISWKSGDVVRDLLSWQTSGIRAAYVVRDEAGAMLAKILARPDSRSEIETFKTCWDAQAWLDASAAFDPEP